jgi:hypothetical protein
LCLEVANLMVELKFVARVVNMALEPDIEGKRGAWQTYFRTDLLAEKISCVSTKAGRFQ